MPAPTYEAMKKKKVPNHSEDRRKTCLAAIYKQTDPHQTKQKREKIIRINERTKRQSLEYFLKCRHHRKAQLILPTIPSDIKLFFINNFYPIQI